ncbi:MAG: hypothetical protein IJW21_01530 [Clostridia bacterium]|nr:hypothetical protein [Clostridia bacterium]
MFKTICPYCGGRCETYGGTDGNPYNQNRREISVCTSCGRTAEREPCRIPAEYLEELLADADIGDEADARTLKISATATGGGVTRKAELALPYEDGTYPLGYEYPFGRVDADAVPRFSLCSVRISGGDIFIANEAVKADDLPATVTKKLTAYGYNKFPTEEIITLLISFE